MARKLNKTDHADDSRMVDAVRDSVEQIWQAGLGAFAKAQREGEEMFSKLVQEGMAVQKRTQEAAGAQWAGLSETVAQMAENLGKQASGSWEKLENVFEERVAQAMRGLGVPTHDDIETLNARIGELHQMVNALIAKKDAGKPAAKKTAAKAAKRQPAKSAVKKPAAKKRSASSGRKAASSGVASRA
ncbi:MAG TPA: phasin family protein [Noviherbaspirillum sp.]|nr:phasin family protein [Noviherbaspirillum sp.]